MKSSQQKTTGYLSVVVNRQLSRDDAIDPVGVTPMPKKFVRLSGSQKITDRQDTNVSEFDRRTRMQSAHPLRGQFFPEFNCEKHRSGFRGDKPTLVSKAL